MRKLIFAINLTLDGCCDHTKGRPSEDVHDYFTALLQETDLMVYGRKTYELMVPFWPEMARERSAPIRSMNDFAQEFDAIPKLVFSRSLERVEDRHSSIARQDLQTTILALKQQEGKSILTGGVDLPTQLIELGLVDEFIFMMQPVLAGEGRRLLDATKWQTGLRLKLVSQKVLEDGSVALRYVKE